MQMSRARARVSGVGRSWDRPSPGRERPPKGRGDVGMRWRTRLALGLDTVRHRMGGGTKTFAVEHVFINAAGALGVLGALLLVLELPEGRARRLLTWGWLVGLLGVSMEPFPAIGHGYSALALVAI